jgi:hypothetical protein
VTASGSFLKGTDGRSHLVVVQGKDINHYWREDKAPGSPWRGPHLVHSWKGATGGLIATEAATPIAASLIQSAYGHPGNLEIVARVRSPGPKGDYLVHLVSRLLEPWSQPRQINVFGVPIDGVTGDPALIQTSDIGNFELLVARGSSLDWFTRDNIAPGYNWYRRPHVPLATNPYGALYKPSGSALFQPDFPDRALQAIFCMDGLLAWRVVKGGIWEGRNIGIDAHPQTILNVTGKPAVIQSSFGHHGNYEIVAPQGNAINHYWFDNDLPLEKRLWQSWNGPNLVAQWGGGAHGLGPRPSSVSMIENDSQELEVIAFLRPSAAYGGGSLVHIVRGADNHWGPPQPILADGKPIDGVTGF